MGYIIGASSKTFEKKDKEKEDEMGGGSEVGTPRISITTITEETEMINEDEEEEEKEEEKKKTTVALNDEEFDWDKDDRSMTSSGGVDSLRRSSRDVTELELEEERVKFEQEEKEKEEKEKEEKEKEAVDDDEEKN